MELIIPVDWWDGIWMRQSTVAPLRERLVPQAERSADWLDLIKT